MPKKKEQEIRFVKPLGIKRDKLKMTVTALEENCKKRKKEYAKLTRESSMSSKKILRSPAIQSTKKTQVADIDFRDLLKKMFKKEIIPNPAHYPRNFEKNEVDESFFSLLFASPRLSDFNNKEFMLNLAFVGSVSERTTAATYLVPYILESNIVLPITKRTAKENRELGMIKTIHGNSEINLKDYMEELYDLETNAFKLVSIIKMLKDSELSDEFLEDLAQDVYIWRVKLITNALPMEDAWRDFLRPNYKGVKIKSAWGLYLTLMEKLFSPIYFAESEYIQGSKVAGKRVIKRFKSPITEERRPFMIGKEIFSRIFDYIENKEVVKGAANYVKVEIFHLKPATKIAS